MSHLSSVFNKVPVKIQDRSGFDMSHENLFTATVGTLIPASVEEVMPGDVVSVGSAMSVELPPLATNFKGRVDAKLEAFFVPNRLLWAGWQDYITQDANHKPNIPNFSTPTELPKVRLNQNNAAPGSLADYLGVKGVGTTTVPTDVNALPFLAYQKIWDDWYRDTNVQNPFFVDGIQSANSASTNVWAAGAPYLRNSGVMSGVTGNIWASGSQLGNNGRLLTELAQRNFAKDYFTTMTTAPQAGAAAELQFTVEATGDPSTMDGSFSIASLRAANSLQKWLERNNIAGTRYYDQILAHYGVLPPDANVQRAVLLGSMTAPVIVNTIKKQTETTSTADPINLGKNPYSQSAGSNYGSGNSFDKGSLIDNFEVKEHGFVIILFSLVPHAYYGTGCRRYLLRDKSGDFAFPEFANIGDQPVYKAEMTTDIAAENWRDTVGYNQRYSEYKYHDDEVHGLLASGFSLDNFVLQRGFDDTVTVSSDLLEIPTTYMDDVMVTTSRVSGFNAIVDCYFDSKYLRVLPEYSLPSL